MSDPSIPSRETRVAEALDAYVRALQSGQTPEREPFLARYPDLRTELEDALHSVEFVHRTAHDLASTDEGEIRPEGRVLGDYRLLREVGRGGMAVVYEAEQVSLGRRVALKVLPFAAVLDPRQLQRFKNEALAAAHLQHPHIVPVYGVGCERGVHYYAMQYVEGQSLALAIRDLKAGGSTEGPKTPISSHGSNREPGYVRMAAELGMQAAQALDHAHQLGIVHRDVKPGNLLVDPTGALWISDFGLARSAHDGGLTVTGELLGTVRYMSPEQALAKRVPVDHRTDVYSLGATLYELITLEPAFPGDDPHLVIQAIASTEPAPPRRLNPALPRDLETVVLKAMAKEPARRYTTAQEMAEDLWRYLEGKPVLARRPGIAVRAASWARHHGGLVAAASAVLLTGIGVLLADGVRVAHQRDRAEANLVLARGAVDRFLVESGVANLEDRPFPSPTRRALLEAALAFYESNLDDVASLGQRVRILHELHRFGDGLLVLDRILRSSPRNARALAERGHFLWHLGRPEDALAALALASEVAPSFSDPHFFRGVVLQSLGKPLEAIAAFRESGRLGPDGSGIHNAIAGLLAEQGDTKGAIDEYRAALGLSPKDSSARYNLAITLEEAGDEEAAIPEYRTAIHWSPDLAPAHNNLGRLLQRRGDPDGALLAFREGVRLDRTNLRARLNLGHALVAKAMIDDAIREYQEVIRLGPETPEAALAYMDWGAALQQRGDFDGMIKACNDAIHLMPLLAGAHFNLGVALMGKGEAGQAVVAFREASSLRQDDALARQGLGQALERTGDLQGAIAALRESAQIRPDSATYFQLAGVLAKDGDLKGAVGAYREAATLRPDDLSIHCNLGCTLDQLGEHEDAIVAYRKALSIDPDDADSLCNLGLALLRKGESREALSLLRKGDEQGRKRPEWTHPSLAWVESAEKALELDRRLGEVLAGWERPRDATERALFARQLHAKGRYAEAVRMWSDAFTESAALADQLATGHRYNAACSAVLAAAGRGAEGAAFRGSALAWLRADLAARGKDSLRHAEAVGRWPADADFESVRDRIPDLPAAEREGWSLLWADVHAFNVRAREEPGK